MQARIEGNERNRRELRRGVALTCEIESDYWDEAVPHRLLDLSPSGGFVETMLPLAADEELELIFHPPRSSSLYWLRARVVRTSFGRRCPVRDVPGMGVEFLDFTESDRSGLAKLLVGLPPRAPITRRTPYRSVESFARTIGGRAHALGGAAHAASIADDVFAPIALAPLLY